MKTLKQISGAVMALLCMTAPAVSEAQETLVSPVESDLRLSSVSDFVPGSLSKDGLCKLTFKDFDATIGAAKVTCVDGGLTAVAEINVTADSECYSSGGECMGKLDFKWDSIERNTMTDINTWDYDVIQEYLAKKTGVQFYGYTEYMPEENYSKGVVYMSADDSSYKVIDGIRVPWWFFYETNGQLVEVKCTGNCTITRVLPEDYEKHVYYYTPILTPAFKDYDNGTSTLGNVTLSQTLFDNNDNFEYLSPIYAEPETESREEILGGYLYDYDSSFAFKAFFVESQRPGHIIGFRIMREDGSELQSVLFGDDFYANSADFMSILLFGGKKYLCCALNGSTALYEINAATNEVKKVATYKTRVYPTLVDSTENINIELGDGGNTKRCINISDLSGKHLYSAKADSQAGRTTLPASVMSKGMNIVTVSDAEGESVSTKVIVK